MKVNAVAEFHKSRENRIFALRVLVTVCLLVAAALVGTLNYKTLTETERKYALSRYDVISRQMQIILVDKIKAMCQGSRVMARSYSYAHPRRRKWPKYILDGFYNVAEELKDISYLETIVYAPILYNLTADSVSSFEDYMFSVFNNDSSVPVGAGITPAGRGIWGINASRTGDASYYLDTTGVVSYNSTLRQNVLVPVLQKTYSGDLNARFFACNLHSRPIHGYPLDMMFACVQNSQNNSDAVASCVTLSGTTHIPFQVNASEDISGMRSYVYQPILLADSTNINAETKAVGVIGGSLNWQALLSVIVPKFVNGVDCVMTTSTGEFTFRIQNGVAVFVGVGDHHDRAYTDRAHTSNIVDTVGILSHSEYVLNLYPTSEFFDAYETQTPLNTTVGGILIVLFCACVFVVYDWAVRGEFTRKEIVLDTKRRFVRFISHEMRTPMNTVHMGLKLFQMEMQNLLHETSYSSAEVSVGLLRAALANWMPLVDDVLGNSESAVDVLNDLLNYDKIETGTLHLELSSVEIWAVLKKTVSAFMMQAKQMNVDLQLTGECWTTNTSGELQVQEKYNNMRVVGDSTRIAQVVRNLLSNALKFTPEHGAVTMKVTVVRDGLPHARIVAPDDYLDLLDDPRAGSIRISVTDSGAGLSESQLKHIGLEGVQFNANELQAGGGSGLGLYISKGLVQQHGGKLSVWSEGLGTGSTFTVELPLFLVSNLRLKPAPLTVPAYAAAVLPYAGSPIAQQAYTPRPFTVLVVDDAPSNRKLLMRILQTKGYRCFDAEDGQKAVDAYQRLLSEGVRLDAIVMDFEMPVMNGPTATKVLRDLGCSCFIAGVTGNVLPQDVDYFRSQGANRVIPKPLNIEVFEAYLASYRAAPPTRADSAVAHLHSLQCASDEIKTFEPALSVDSLDLV